MAPTLKKVICDYIKLRGSSSEGFLFLNAYGAKIHPDTLNKNISDYNRNRGINTIGVHKFRHTFAKLWVLNGGDVFRLKSILGHSSLEMTSNYVNLLTGDIQNNFNEFNPLESLRKSQEKIKLW